ncbi:MAG: ATP-binding cassette domain-containing protein, partial [Pseudomonadales bacterium]
MAVEEKPILRLQNLHASTQGVELIRNVNLDVSSGEILALIGPNGAGKSSLLKAIVGDIETDAGEVFFADRLRASYKPRELAQQLAYLPQNSELNFPFETLDVVLMGRIPHSSGASRDLQIAEQALAMVDMAHLADRLYTRLSGGERQRVQLARVLAQIACGD